LCDLIQQSNNALHLEDVQAKLKALTETGTDGIQKMEKAAEGVNLTRKAGALRPASLRRARRVCEGDKAQFACLRRLPRRVVASGGRVSGKSPGRCAYFLKIARMAAPLVPHQSHFTASEPEGDEAEIHSGMRPDQRDPGRRE
jgi:hypothetical protein